MKFLMSCFANPFSRATVIFRHCHKKEGIFFRVYRDFHRESQQVKMKKFKPPKVKQISKTEKYKDRLEKVPVSGVASLHVLSTGASGLGRSLLLRTNYDRYLFNCGEAVQKFVHYCCPRLGVVDNIFMTSHSWNNVGGLLGFMMSNTTELHHTKPVNVHGPENVGKSLAMLPYFSEGNVKKSTSVEWRGLPHGSFEDDQLTVDYVPLYEASHDADNLQSESSSDDTTKKTGKYAVAYIVKLKQMLPKINTEKLLELKLRRGPWIGELLKGQESVTVPDGRVISLKDVCDSLTENLGPLVVLECPTIDYIDSLRSSPQFVDLEPNIMVHMSPVDVTNDGRYQAFISRFKCAHLMLNETCPNQVYEPSHSHSSVLHKVHPGIFPLLSGHNCPPPTEDKMIVDRERNIVNGFCGLTYNVRPVRSQGFKWDDIASFDSEVMYKNECDKSEKAHEKFVKHQYADEEPFSRENFDKEMTKWQQILNDKDSDVTHLSEEYPELVFLGTGSAKPSSLRNCSFILLHMRKDEYMILDCGEGSLYQLMQMYGEDRTGQILSNVKAVFVSHLHLDHHGGLFQLLEFRKRYLSRAARENEKKLLLFAPMGYMKWLKQYYQNHDDIAHEIEFFPHQAMYKLHLGHQEHEKMGYIRDMTGLAQYLPVPVIHAPNSYGVVMKHQDGWKITYSGDTMPCKTLVKYGKDSDILIHEGTFGDDDGHHAEEKLHSMTGQAIQVGKDMNAKYTMLTHFSQRFSKIPIFSDAFSHNIGYAFDFMQIRPSQLRLMHHMQGVFYNFYGADLNLHESRNKPQTVENNSDEKNKTQNKQLLDALSTVKKEGKYSGKQQGGKSKKQSNSGDRTEPMSERSTNPNIHGDNNTKQGDNIGIKDSGGEYSGKRKVELTSASNTSEMCSGENIAEKRSRTDVTTKHLEEMDITELKTEKSEPVTESFILHDEVDEETDKKCDKEAALKH